MFKARANTQELSKIIEMMLLIWNLSILSMGRFENISILRITKINRKDRR